MNAFKSKANSKAEETGERILDVALELFRQEGFDGTTMRDVAKKAGVATGAAYYYYPSKDAIVMDFYRRSSAEMQPRIEAALATASTFEERLRKLIQVKLAHFAPDRGVLRALLRNGADPLYPLSPFSSQTKPIRDTDIGWFARILEDSGLRIPRDLKPHLPGVLWFYQMGVIYFWVIDGSLQQTRTAKLLDLSIRSIAILIQLSALPLMRPLRRFAIQLIEIITIEPVKEE